MIDCLIEFDTACLTFNSISQIMQCVPSSMTYRCTVFHLVCNLCHLILIIFIVKCSIVIWFIAFMAAVHLYAWLTLYFAFRSVSVHLFDPVDKHTC